MIRRRDAIPPSPPSPASVSEAESGDDTADRGTIAAALDPPTVPRIRAPGDAGDAGDGRIAAVLGLDPFDSDSAPHTESVPGSGTKDPLRTIACADYRAHRSAHCLEQGRWRCDVCELPA